MSTCEKHSWAANTCSACTAEEVTAAWARISDNDLLKTINNLELEIEATNKAYAAVKAELAEQCRLNGMGSEREARLVAQVQELIKAAGKQS